jgi:flagellar basal-body rod modification protein FlgD
MDCRAFAVREEKMAAATLGILNHPSSTGPDYKGAVPLINATNNSASDGGASAAGAGASVTANDFLTLLVTELKNQDPTANTDPNEYINQLVQVNSLAQLVSINQTLIADSQSAAGSPVANGAGVTIHNKTLAAGEFRQPDLPASFVETPNAQAATTGSAGAAPTAVGNFTLPAPDPAAQRVARSLGRIQPAV